MRIPRSPKLAVQLPIDHNQILKLGIVYQTRSPNSNPSKQSETISWHKLYHCGSCSTSIIKFHHHYVPVLSNLHQSACPNAATYDEISPCVRPVSAGSYQGAPDSLTKHGLYGDSPHQTLAMQFVADTKTCFTTPTLSGNTPGLQLSNSDTQLRLAGMASLSSHIRQVHRNNVAVLRDSPALEVAGALGDLGTLLPLMIVLAINGSISLSTTLVFSGVFNLVTGVVFGVPLPVQPMKVRQDTSHGIAVFDSPHLA